MNGINCESCGGVPANEYCGGDRLSRSTCDYYAAFLALSQPQADDPTAQCIHNDRNAEAKFKANFVTKMNRSSSALVDHPEDNESVE